VQQKKQPEKSTGDLGEDENHRPIPLVGSPVNPRDPIAPPGTAHDTESLEASRTSPRFQAVRGRWMSGLQTIAIRISFNTYIYIYQPRKKREEVKSDLNLVTNCVSIVLRGTMHRDISLGHGYGVFRNLQESKIVMSIVMIAVQSKKT
jgi:hypothetical protein